MGNTKTLPNVIIGRYFEVLKHPYVRGCELFEGVKAPDPKVEIVYDVKTLEQRCSKITDDIHKAIHTLHAAVTYFEYHWQESFAKSKRFNKDTIDAFGNGVAEGMNNILFGGITALNEAGDLIEGNPKQLDDPTLEDHFADYCKTTATADLVLWLCLRTSLRAIDYLNYMIDKQNFYYIIELRDLISNSIMLIEDVDNGNIAKYYHNYDDGDKILTTISTPLPGEVVDDKHRVLTKFELIYLITTTKTPNDAQDKK